MVDYGSHKISSIKNTRNTNLWTPTSARPVLESLSCLLGKNSHSLSKEGKHYKLRLSQSSQNSVNRDETIAYSSSLALC